MKRRFSAAAGVPSRSADAQEKPEPGNPAIKSIQQAAYRALIGLASGHLESQGRQLRVVPGMRVNAVIHLGTPSFLKCLLSPVHKISHETGAGAVGIGEAPK